MRPARECLTQHSAVRPRNKVCKRGESSGIPCVRRRERWERDTDCHSLGSGGLRVDAAASDSTTTPSAKKKKTNLPGRSLRSVQMYINGGVALRVDAAASDSTTTTSAKKVCSTREHT